MSVTKQEKQTFTISENANKKMIIAGFIKYIDYLIDRVNEETSPNITKSIILSILNDEKTALIIKLKSV